MKDLMTDQRNDAANPSIRDPRRQPGESRLWNWIGGERVGPSAGEWFAVPAPRDGEPIREVPASGYMDVVRAVQAAHAALPGWQRFERAARAEALLKVADAIDAHADLLAQDEAWETGQPIRLALGRSIPDAGMAFRAAAERLLASDECAYLSSPFASSIWLARADGGVAGLILPAFEPTLAFATRASALLAAGGAAIAKPPSTASRSCLRLAEIAESAGLPKGLLNVVCGRGADAGEAIVAHPGIRWLAFAGETETGRRILSAAALEGKRVQLSLGSRNAAIAFLDAPLRDEGAEAAARVLFDLHRPPARASRLLAQERSEAFAAIAQAASRLKLGDPLLESTDVGPLPRERHWKRAQAQAAQAGAEQKKSGGSEAAGAPSASLPAGGFYCAPRLASDLTFCSPLQQEETLGPLVTHGEFKYAHQAAARANASPFGSTSFIWTTDGERAAKLSSKLECGRVCLGFAPPRLEVSFTSAKGSGFGAEGLAAWLDFFSWPHPVLAAGGARRA